MKDLQKEIFTLWRHVDPLSVRDAAALIVGIDPHRVDSEGRVSNEDGATTNWDDTEAFDVMLKMLTSAILAGLHRATIRRTAWMRGWDEHPIGGYRYAHHVRAHQLDLFDTIEEEDDFRKVQHAGVIYRVEPDWNMSTLRVADLCAFLQDRGVSAPFFLPLAPTGKQPGYLDPAHPRFAPKLAASIDAWEAVTDTEGHSPKQLLEQRLREQASRFGLVDKHGHIIKQAIEECARVANWSIRGGAPVSSKENVIPS